MLRLGVQVSSAGRIHSSLERAKNLNCNTMQIFARNPRQFRKASLKKDDIEFFKREAKKKRIHPIAIHIPYTLNLASSRERFHRITIREFIIDLLEADKLGAHYLVTHIGSYKGSTERRGLLKIIKALKKILQATERVKTMILLENTSGSGHWLGYNFSHMGFVLDNLNWPKKIGICLDTAHAWSAGYKIDEEKGLNNLLKEINQEVGIKRLKVIHLNDTQEKLGSRRDRHFHIGEGRIGKRGFQLILTHPFLRNLPFILETPKKSDSDDIRNLNMVRQLYKDKRP